MLNLIDTDKSVHTSLPLFNLECEIQGPDGEVHSLWIHAANMRKQCQNEAPLTTNKTRQQLRDPVSKRQCSSAGKQIKTSKSLNFH